MQTTLTRPLKNHIPTAVIQPEGSLNAENAIKLQSLIKAAALSDQYSSLMLDMHQVEVIDSAGLMVLVSGFRLAQHANKRFCLCSVSHSVRIILELTQLDNVLEILESPITTELVA